jgi:hypothetical protein
VSDSGPTAALKLRRVLRFILLSMVPSMPRFGGALFWCIISRAARSSREPLAGTDLHWPPSAADTLSGALAILQRTRPSISSAAAAWIDAAFEHEGALPHPAEDRRNDKRSAEIRIDRTPRSYRDRSVANRRRCRQAFRHQGARDDRMMVAHIVAALAVVAMISRLL